jgi:hypothetical protein
MGTGVPQTLQKIQRGAMREREAIEVREIEEAGAEVFIAAWFVHPLEEFGGIGARAEVDLRGHISLSG